MKKNLIFIFVALAVILLVFVFYSPSFRESQEPEKISLQLQWIHYAGHTGFYVAKEKGFYKDEGLDVEFVEGGPQATIIENVVAGKSDFGVAPFFRIIPAQEGGLSIKALAVYYQKNPAIIAASFRSGIKEPKDLLGRTVAMSPNVISPFRAMMDKLGLDTLKVNLVPLKFNGVEQLQSGEVDAASSFIGNQDTLHRASGFEIVVINPSDYGIEFYQDTIFTTDKIIAESPDVVERFLRATLKGLKYYYEHPEEAVDIKRIYAVDSERTVDEDRIKFQLPLVISGDGRFGVMDPEKVSAIQSILLSQGLVDRILPLENILAPQFVEKIYRESSI